MSLLRIRQTIPAGGVNNNLLQGSTFEYLGRSSAVTVFASEDGTTPNSIQIDWLMGNAVVGRDLGINNAAVAGNVDRQADGIGSAIGIAGDRIQLAARNLDAANPTNVTALIEITDL